MWNFALNYLWKIRRARKKVDVSTCCGATMVSSLRINYILRCFFSLHDLKCIVISVFRDILKDSQVAVVPDPLHAPWTIYHKVLTTCTKLHSEPSSSSHSRYYTLSSWGRSVALETLHIKKDKTIIFQCVIHDILLVPLIRSITTLTCQVACVDLCHGVTFMSVVCDYARVRAAAMKWHP